MIWRDLRRVLDQEVAGLPEAYRRPIVLCYLEGKTNDEAARLWAVRKARSRPAWRGRATASAGG